MRTLLLGALFATACSSIPRWAREPLPSATLSEPELEVVTALLSDPATAESWGAPESALVLDEAGRTGTAHQAHFWGPGGEYCPPDDLLAALPTTGLARARLPRAISYGPFVQLHSWRQFMEVFYSRDEAAFTTRYSHYVNVISVSRVAFSLDRQHAIVSVLHLSPRTGCSVGYLAYLQLAGGQWFVLTTGDYAVS